MKPVKILLCIASCFVSANTFAQSPKAIEADLLKSFKKIDYWDQKQKNGHDGASDSLAIANATFEKMLLHSVEKYPFTLNTPFTSLGKKLQILSSVNGLIRIFSWDTHEGGTQHVFENIIQYKSGQKTSTFVDHATGEDTYPFTYDKLYTLKAKAKTYYLATFFGIFSNSARGEGIKVISIENGKLNYKTKLIKTQKGLTDKLYYSYNQNATNEDIMSDTTLEYDSKTQTITFPVIWGDGKVTSKFITYKFNGQYFEKVKS